jgi:hypothetical protein
MSDAPQASNPLFDAVAASVPELFYGIAIYEGYKFSFRTISEGEIATLTRQPSEQEHHV